MIRIDESGIEIVKLREDGIHLVEGFDCGDVDLNEFLKKDSLTYLEGKLAVTYLLLHEGNLRGFFCVSNDSIPLGGKDRRVLQKLGKRQKTYPALKIGRLGIQKEFQNKGFGTFIVNYVVGMALIHSKKVGCRYIAVDAYDNKRSLSFYKKNGFKMLKETRRETNIPMYLDLLKKT